MTNEDEIFHTELKHKMNFFEQHSLIDNAVWLDGHEMTLDDLLLLSIALAKIWDDI